ncbi:MAG: GNAT family N-acetyltransferase [Ferruginibacter sp.]
MYKTLKAELKHVEELAVLFNSYRLFYKQEPDAEIAIKFLSERLGQNESVVYVTLNSTNEMVGFVQLYPLFSSTRMKKLWLLNDLFVDEKHRGKGISIALINKCKELCITTDALGLMLETSKNNMEANKLYQKTGFLLKQDTNYYTWQVT